MTETEITNAGILLEIVMLLNEKLVEENDKLKERLREVMATP